MTFVIVSRNMAEPCPSVFISRAPEDDDLAVKIIETLKPLGITCFDFKDFHPGKTVVGNSEESIKESNCVLLLLTENFGRSDWASNIQVLVLLFTRLL